jgi:DNA-binding IclR family transcriptional regulator
VDKPISGVGVLDKAMSVLDIVEFCQPVSFAEIHQQTSLPKSTVHRLVLALEMHGFLRRDADGRVVTGTRFVTGMLPQIAEPILRRLTEETGESSQVYVRRGEHRLCVAAVESPQELRTTVGVGTLLTIERGSAGRVLSGDGNALKRGWIQSVADRAPGIASVSAPIFDGSVLIAAVSVSGPIDRLGTSPGLRYAPPVVAAAKEIQAALAAARG